MEFKEIYDTMMHPTRGTLGKAWTAGMNRLGAAVRVPDVPLKSDQLRAYGGQLGRLIWRFNIAVNRALVTFRESVLDMQLVQERIAGAAIEMFASACTLSRWDSELRAGERNGDSPMSGHRAADLFVKRSFHNIRRWLAELGDNEDGALLATADAVLGKSGRTGSNGH
jgi:hypothetical protein